MKKNRKGFTLIEVVVALALVGIVIAMVFTPITFTFSNYTKQSEKTYMISDTRHAMDYLTRQIRKSSQVEVANNRIQTDFGVYGQAEGGLVKYHAMGDDHDEKVAEGVDQLNVNKTGNEIRIEIIAKDSKGNDYSLASTINIR